jgi:hypothetical protein
MQKGIEFIKIGKCRGQKTNNQPKDGILKEKRIGRCLDNEIARRLGEGRDETRPEKYKLSLLI